MSIFTKNYKRHLISMLLSAVAVAGSYFLAPFVGAAEISIQTVKFACLGALIVFLRELVKIIEEAAIYLKNKKKVVAPVNPAV